MRYSPRVVGGQRRPNVIIQQVREPNPLPAHRPSSTDMYRIPRGANSLMQVLVTTKVALVTGAARGIGRAIALRLAEDGFDVAVNDLPNSAELDEVLREIEKRGRRSLAVRADVSVEPELARIIQEVVQKLGSLDVLSPSD
ncbi:hypothetical protein BJV74DRAFT_985943, partial [Russula compacta]